MKPAMHLNLSFMKPIVPIFLCLLFAACSSEPSEPSDRPGSVHGKPDTPDHGNDSELTEALADGRQRVVTPDVTFLYDGCGIIFGRTATGSLYCLDITDGRRVDFNPTAETLSISGKNAKIKSVELARRTESTTWWIINLTEPANSRVIFVTDF